MAFFGFGHGRDDHSRGRWTRGFMGYDRDHRDPGVWTLNEPGWGTAAYDAGYQFEHPNHARGYGMGHRGPMGYDRGYGMARSGGGYRYGADYAARWQRDHGDPFGDRAARTPMRVVRGGFRGSSEPQYSWETGYDRDYASNPMGYEPYFNRDDLRHRGGGRSRGYGRRYDY